MHFISLRTYRISLHYIATKFAEILVRLNSSSDNIISSLIHIIMNGCTINSDIRYNPKFRYTEICEISDELIISITQNIVHNKELNMFPMVNTYYG